MKTKRNYFKEIQYGFELRDTKTIENAINDFYDYYEDCSIDEEFEEAFSLNLRITQFICQNFGEKYDLLKKINIRIDLLNEEIVGYIAGKIFNSTRKLIDKKILNEVVDNKQGETVEDFISSEFYHISQAYYWQAYGDSDKMYLITPEAFEGFEKAFKDLSNLVLIGFRKTKTIKKSNDDKDDVDLEHYKKFIGNSLEKRNNENNIKYEKVARILKIAEIYYPQLKLTQKNACGMAGCNEFSFARWKNYGDNFELFLKWQKNIEEQQIEEIKKDIIKYYNLHTEM